MSKHNPAVVEIKTLKDARKEVEKIGCDPKSINIMAPKAVFKTIFLENVHPIDAIIIKQDMLSIGGEVAIPMDVFEQKNKNCRILVMGTLKQFKELTQKLDRHYPRIKEISKELKKFLRKVR
ncbi:MAG TPA: hypothetical protein ENI42_02145 [Thermoplasmatales archaeon]|nr:hypothetical protein [Thermoplasmatales archaeon]